MRILFLIILFISLSVYSEELIIHQCCILIDVIENREVTGYETWDFRISSGFNQYKLEVVSYVYMENSWYSYVWTQEIKNIVPRGNNSYIIRTDGRASSFDMIISLSLKGNRIKELTATLPIGTDGKHKKYYRLNTSKRTFNIPIHNSAYKD